MRRGETARTAEGEREPVTPERASAPDEHAATSERILVEACPDVLVLARIDGTVIEANEAALRMLNTTREQLLGSCAYDLFPPHVAQGRRAMVAEVARTRMPRREMDFNGTLVVDNLLVPLFDAAGEVDRVAIYARDITAQVHAARDAREQQRQQHEADKSQALKDLASDVAHEFNNLLTPIVNYLRLAKREERDGGLGARTGLLDSALCSAERAAQLIENVVRAEVDHLPPQTAPPSPSRKRMAAEPHPPEGEAMTVLAIDDEAGVLQVVEVALLMSGHQAHCFQTARDGLERFTQDPSAFDAAILDQNLSDGTGVEVARRLRELSPDLRIVLASGRPSSELRSAAESLGLRLLAKPYSVEGLQGALCRD